MELRNKRSSVPHVPSSNGSRASVSLPPVGAEDALQDTGSLSCQSFTLLPPRKELVALSMSPHPHKNALRAGAPLG